MDSLPLPAPDRMQAGLQRIQGLRDESRQRLDVFPKTPTISAATRSLNRHSLLAVVGIFALFGGLVAWSAATEIAGAVVSSGVIVVDAGSQLVQHPDGGIVREILVENDDKVTAGQVLLRFDGTATSASLAIVENQLRESYAQEARLVAESAQATDLRLPSSATALADRGGMTGLLAEQERLRAARAASRAQKSEQLKSQIDQLQQQISGLSAQIESGRKSIALAAKQDENVSALFAKKLVGAERYNTVKQARAQLESTQAGLTASLAEAKASIGEHEVGLGQIAVDFQSEVLTDLQTLRQKIAELQQQAAAAEDKLRRLDVRAPQAGTIHQSTIHTVGGVIAAGETMMMVVPEAHGLVVDTRLSQNDIDKVAPGQDVVMKLPSLAPRTTPDLRGKVVNLSPDLIRDSATGQVYYAMRVTADDAELKKLDRSIRLIPGMPVEAFAQTGERTVLSFLVQPMSEQFARVFVDR